MKTNLFPTLLSVLAILCHEPGVNAEFCPDDVAAGMCFKDSIVPLAIGATTAGSVFGIFLVVLSLCLFCKTKVKNGEIDWVNGKETSNWVEESQNFGLVNKLHHLEQRKQGLGDDKPQHFVSDRCLYSERATSAFSSSYASDIMNAMDEIQDNESEAATSPYYWVPALQENEKEQSEHAETTTSRNIHSGQILHHTKFGNKMDDNSLFGGSTTHS